MTLLIDHKERQKAQWSGVAEAWDRRFEWYSAAFRPLMEWCCDAARLAPGMQVLDAAGGSGQPAMTAAARVAPGGRVVSVDISPEMVARAARRAKAAGVGNLEVIEMDAERLRFGDRSFDAVTCTCGLMFFPDVQRALAEMRRVLKPGGRLAAAVWDVPARSPFLTAGGKSVAQFFPPAPPDPSAPGGFRFSNPGELQALLQQAGFVDVAVESRPMTIEFGSADEYWEVFSELGAGIMRKIATLSADDGVRLRTLVADATKAYFSEGRLRLVATPLCAGATSAA